MALLDAFFGREVISFSTKRHYIGYCSNWIFVMRWFGIEFDLGFQVKVAIHLLEKRKRSSAGLPLDFYLSLVVFADGLSYALK